MTVHEMAIVLEALETLAGLYDSEAANDDSGETASFAARATEARELAEKLSRGDAYSENLEPRLDFVNCRGE